MLLPAVAVVVIGAARAYGETITDAHYGGPVERYGHFAPGRPHEYARVVATTSTGRRLELELPSVEVFEDVAPRLVALGPGAAPDLLTIVSGRDSGARLAVIRLRDGRLQMVAQSEPIGTAMRWLNPVGVADLNGDGRPEIAAVITPHIGGTLRIYRLVGPRLVGIAALGGFSNHVYGSGELRLSAVVPIDGRMRLVIPDTTRRQLRIIGLEGDMAREVGRCTLSEPVSGPVEVLAAATVSVGLSSERRIVDLTRCR
ncbi:MAG: VCBS repeat-containing protein [Casimicrobiaceae bacterium]